MLREQANHEARTLRIRQGVEFNDSAKTIKVCYHILVSKTIRSKEGGLAFEEPKSKPITVFMKQILI
jgi:hypothetical protein